MVVYNNFTLLHLVNIRNTVRAMMLSGYFIEIDLSQVILRSVVKVWIAFQSLCSANPG